MNAFCPRPLPSKPGVSPAPAITPLNAVIVYDDFAAGDRAVHTLHDLRARLGAAVALDPTPWSFDFLAELPWRTRALRDVQSADLVILSLSEPDDVPSSINHWIETCLMRQHRTSVPVLVQFGPDEVWTLSCETAPASVPAVSLSAAGRDFAYFPFNGPLLRPTPLTS